MTTTTGGDLPQPEFMTVKEVAAMIGAAESTLRYWATQTKTDGPPSFRLHGRRVYRRRAVLDWISEQERATTNRPQAVNG